MLLIIKFLVLEKKRSYAPRAERLIAGLVVLLTATACVSPPPLLNSERIFERYGSYGVEVLAQRDDLRITNLFSGDPGNRTTRTLAIVRFEENDNAALSAAHMEVLAGASIGATLKARGFVVEKTTLAIDELLPTAVTGRYLNLMRLDEPSPLALHAYRLLARAGSGTAYPYATIIEVHHPAYLTVSDLSAIFADQPTAAPGSGEVERLLVAGGQYADLW